MPVLLGLAAALGALDFVRAMEWRTLDWRTQYRAHSQPEPDPRIHLILFDDDTYVNLVTWPPSRKYHGSLVELLSMAGASVVSFDVILDARRDDGGDEAMAVGVGHAFERGTRIVTGAVTSEVVTKEEPARGPGPTRPLTDFTGDRTKLVGDESALRPFPELRAVAAYGFVDQPREAGGGILREPPLVVRVGHEVYPSLGLQTLMAYFDVKTEAVKVRLGDAVYLPTKTQGELRIPISEAGRFLLNYRYEMDAGQSNFPAYGYGVLSEGLYARFIRKSTEAAPPPDLRGAILIVGQYITGNSDSGPTPRSPMAPLPLIHANLLNNVLAGDYARHVPWWAVWLGVGGFVWIGASIIARRSLTSMVVFALAG
ncbi:MAG TPA: CHASE2 domain-containing protein, partial [Rariglobus sp.]